MKPLTRYRLLCSVVIAILVALGLGSKAYSGWGHGWVNHFSGDILYEMFWIWLVGSLKVRWPVGRIAIATFCVTSLIECSQLIPFPDAWTRQLWWRLLLGTHFSWPDFLYYAAGCLIGGLSLSALKEQMGIAERVS